MTNTSSNSGSSRRANALNSATAAHLAILSTSPYSPPTNMSGSHYSAMLSAQSSQPRTTLSWSNAYPNSTSTSYASGSSTRTTYYNHPLTSSSSPLNRPASIPQTKSNPPVTKLPDYLSNTNYAELYYKAHEKDGNDVDKDLLENVALPTEWNVDDKCSHLSVDSDRLKVNYIGSGKNDADAAAIRANHSMPPQCGLFYFEIDIISKGKDGYIGIGFCAKQVHLNRLPGWENDSWGYHGDDGHSFCCSGSGKPYGPGFTTGDTIGCCLNFRDGTAFYTKNGKHLGIAFRDLKGILYPSIGLRTQGESIEANFGHRKFKFAIEHYMKEEKTRLWNEINSIPMDLISSPLTTAPISQAASEANLTSAVHHLILSYLVHHGYSDTAKTFSRNTVQLPQIDNSEMEGVESENPLLDKDKDMINRQRIRDAVLAGDIDHAIKLTNTFYPSVLTSNRDIHFQLRCRKFIEMLGACAGTEITLTDHDDDVIRNDKIKAMIDDDIGDDDNDDDDDEVANESNEESGDENDDEEEEEEFEDAMDVDEFAASTSDDSIDDLFGVSSVKKKTSKRQKNVWSGLHGLDGIMAEALKFGYKLQDDYRDDYRDEIKNTLKDAFSLLAYTDPRRSCVSHLLDPSGREPVANSLNSAILVSQGKPAIPPLEKAYRQASVVLRELSRNSVGSSAFVNVRQDCLV